MRVRVKREHHVLPEQDVKGDRWQQGLKKMVCSLASVAVLVSSLVIVGAAAPAAAADPFSCTPGAIYVQSSTQVREFAVNVEGGAPGNGGTLSATSLGSGHSDNGLGVSADGRYAYTVTNSASNKTLAKHDRATDETTRTAFSLNSAVLRGAVHPTTGVYYFASGTANSTINLYAWDESTSPQTYVQVGTLRPTDGSSVFGANGDMAFSASGQLVVVADRYIYSVDIPQSLTPSTATIDAKQVHDMGAGVEGNGIAFGNLGHLFVSASNGGSRIIEVDLARGQVVNTTVLDNFAPTDMSSCTFPNTLTLKKDLPGGRHAATDQFGLRIESPDGYKVAQTNAITTGNQAGLQPDYAGPVFTNQGDSFDLTESASGTTVLNRYHTSLRCDQLNSDGTTTPVAVSSANSVTQPAGPRGTEVVCTFTNDRLSPSMELRKTSDPASGTAVSAGQTISYTVEAENTGNTVLDPVGIADDLAGVFPYAKYSHDVTTEIDGSEVTSGAATITGDDLVWNGVLQPGQIVTISYSAVVNDGVEGERIVNRVTASGTPPGSLDPIVPPGVTTEHPVAGFTITKTADPASGTVVEPGRVIHYTVTGTNVGDTALNPVTIADNLADVLEHAQYNGDITTNISGTDVATGAATVSGNALAWAGALQAGQAVTITYSVTINEATSGEVLSNIVSGSATPTTPHPVDPTGPEVVGEPLRPPSVTTEHPVIGSGFTLSKSANPATGTAVEAGDRIEYTITGTNTGHTELEPVEIVDDLSAVLEHAEYNGDVAVDRGAAAIANQTLTWTGSIPQGQSVTITYSVTVDRSVESALLRNVATGEATPQVPEDPTDPNSPTNPGTPIAPPPASTRHPVVDTGFEVAKSADPASGTAVQAGDTIEYTVTGRNTGNTVLAPASIVDDLSAVVAHAQYNEDIAATVGTAELQGTTLTWSGMLVPGAVVVITYTVTVNDDATGVLLSNTVSGKATPLIPEDPTDPDSPTNPGLPLTPRQVRTEHPVANPGFTLTKSADPATGIRVDPGGSIEYTVTGTNTGDTVLSPAAITDNLAGVLANAEYNDDVAASRGAVEVTGNTLSWAGALNPGQDVVITYSVTINSDAGGETLTNSVTGQATPLMPQNPADPNSPTTPGLPVSPPTATTEHPVNEPGFTFSKSVNPASGTAVNPGQVLTYTVTGTNTGETTLNPVHIADDLSGVLKYASYNGDAIATINGGAVAAPVVSGVELAWTGSLEVSQGVMITYSVTVGADGVGETLTNSATGVATPPGGLEITPPPGTTTSPVNVPGFSVSKSADPSTGTAVDPGDIITYTVTGLNTGETELGSVVITDNLSGVLAHAVYNGDAIAAIGGVPASAPAIERDELSWAGELQMGQTVTITYSVTVNGDAGGNALENIASGSATPPGGVPPIETPPATIEHPVNEPVFELTKSADPASGSRVDPGRLITYTVMGINTGETALGPVTITDDLADVLMHAEYNGDASATTNGVPASAPTVKGSAMLWTGVLAIGERVTITYSVTLNGDAGGETITNVATGVAVPPGNVELTPPPATTAHPVGEPGFVFQKTSDPASGSAVVTGSGVTYTLTGVNTGDTALDEVIITDDLSGVLGYARFNNDVVSIVGDRIVTAPVLEGMELTWVGNLAEGETVTITYSVTVNEDAAGKTLKNVAVASAMPPGGENITTSPRLTHHPVLMPLAITGGQILPWVLVLGVALLPGGGVLMLLRRRNGTA